MLIVGLGNPGDGYRTTRHNIGFMAVDRLATHFRTSFGGERGRAQTATFGFKAHHHLLLKPLTYMNLSGEAVVPVMRRDNIAPSELLVIVDDVALPLGRARLRANGSAGGHHGLESIEQQLESRQYWRLRLGVGAAPGPGRMVDHVLGAFSEVERELVGRILDLVPDTVAMWLAGFGNKAMARLNSIDLSPGAQPEAAPSVPERTDAARPRTSAAPTSEPSAPAKRDS